MGQSKEAVSYEDNLHTIQDKRAVILLSGGLDSTVAAALAKRMGWQLWALSVDYGQRHSHELTCAKHQASILKCIEHRVVQIDLGFLGSPLLSEATLPLRTLEEIRKAKEASPAVVPGRNAIFLSLASAWAQALRISTVMIGATIEDQAGFYDCRPEFFEAASKAMGVSVVAPLLSCRKLEVVEMASKWEEVHPEHTSSCYQPADGKPCGRCDPCVIRLDAFAALKLEDPLPYRWRP